MHWQARTRGAHLAVLGLLVLLLSTVALTLSHAQEPQGLGLAVVSVGTTVRDMDRALAFYRDVLEFEPGFDVEFTDPGYDRLVGVFGARVRVVGLSLGPNQIELTEFITPQGRHIPPDSRSNDAWFQHLALVVTDIERATAFRLRVARLWR